MIIRCPSCATTYKIEGPAFDAPQPTFRCSRCKHVFAVQIQQLRDEDAAAAETAEPPTPEAPPASDRGPDAEAGSGARGPADTGAPADTEASRAEPAPPETRAAPRSADPHPEPEPEPEPEPPAPSVPAPRTDGDPVRITELGDTDLPHQDVKPRAPETDPPNARQPYLPEPAEVVEKTDSPDRGPRLPDFRIDDDDLIPPREARAASSKHADGSGSIVPFVSLVGLAVFAFVLVSVIYQMNPQALDSLMRRIPWYGGAVFENRHFKRTLAFESLVSGVQPALNQTEVFVVSGKLVNGNDRGIHRVQVEAQLFDSEGKPLDRQAIFLGNAISAKIIEEMSLREIRLLQSLKPQNAYPIPPHESVNFTIVFPKPGVPVDSFSCRVLSAEVTPGPA